MSGTDLPNFKLKFVAWLFGPLFEWLEAHNISGGFVGLIGFSLLIYFVILRQRPQRKITWYDKNVIAAWFVVLFMTIWHQIKMIQKPKPDYAFLPERVRVRLEKYEQEERAKAEYRMKEEKKK